MTYDEAMIDLDSYGEHHYKHGMHLLYKIVPKLEDDKRKYIGEINSRKSFDIDARLFSSNNQYMLHKFDLSRNNKIPLPKHLNYYSKL